MSPDDFRRIALALPDVVEGAHLGHADFRVGGRIFATLGYPNETRGMVKVTPEQQNDLVRANPAAFVPVNGAWGRQGCTSVQLAAATAAALRPALKMAWEKARAGKPTVKRSRKSHS